MTEPVQTPGRLGSGSPSSRPVPRRQGCPRPPRARVFGVLARERRPVDPSPSRARARAGSAPCPPCPWRIRPDEAQARAEHQGPGTRHDGGHTRPVKTDSRGASSGATTRRPCRSVAPSSRACRAPRGRGFCLPARLVNVTPERSRPDGPLGGHRGNTMTGETHPRPPPPRGRMTG